MTIPPAFPQLNSMQSSSDPLVAVSDPEVAKHPLEVGESFSVNVTIELVNDLFLWQAGLTFNATVLEALSFEEGTFLRLGGSTLWVNGSIDNINGVINYHASSLTGTATGVSGNGTLGTMTFRVRRFGRSALHLINVILLNSSLCEIAGIVLQDYALRIKIPGDINGDDMNNAFDLFELGKAYGSMLGSPKWNEEADINKDNVIDTGDLTWLNRYYGETV
jgi:hypothetical protein